MLRIYIILLVFIGLLLTMIRPTFANQICVLIGQTHEDNGRLICDYQCEDGSSRTRYISGPYCAPQIGQPIGF